MKLNRTLAIGAGAFALMACAAIARADKTKQRGDARSNSTTEKCDRACLNGLLDQYLTAFVAHDATRVPTSQTVKFTENSVQLKLGDGAWKTATNIGSYRIYAADPQAGQAGFMGVLKEDNKLSTFAVRLRVINRRISEIETIITRSGWPGEDALAANKLVTARQAFAQKIAQGEKSSRKKMIAVANSYYEGVERGTGDIVPFADDCYRIENGVPTVKNPSFDFGLVSTSGRKLPNFGAMGCKEQYDTHMYGMDTVSDRRFPLIDEENGLVFAFTRYHANGSGKKCFEAPGYGEVCRAQSGFDRSFTIDLLECFKIRGGEIHEMESVWTILPDGTKPAW